ncbi:bifunctional diguanylate cyclase/phosphodiesterase [Roseibium alexandrii]|uniref:Diguanylate cyclase (GGDEF) domain protein n=1 Tax=Roseibium alexandrii (strain DSM 17067 / NCIMB 14079 / DFL-11) TaxID=244592 RepID=A0A5E8GXI7_ROSAD|nr:EAL domain-containing protein [Roseibium alexandrii]EEE44319.1 diguanylate cyclase (GGDEF) domain protein [Roseibium alexandrii DFL-11]
MKIRSYVIFCFLLAALLPTIIFSVWSYRETVARELADVQDRHLLLAKKAAATLDHYQKNLIAAVEAIGTSARSSETSGAYSRLFEQLFIACVGITDKRTGHTEYFFKTGVSGEGHIEEATLETLLGNSKPDQAVFSNILPDKEGRNRIYLVIEQPNRTLIGVIKPDYIVELGESIVFGEKGHAAIVDSSGTVIAHPRDEWIASRKNISAVPVVAQMMAGNSGVGEFYSPAVETQMIAGFATVPGPGWGIMVPQPVSEIHAKASQVLFSLLPVLGIALVFLMFIGLFLARSLSRPIEELAQAMHLGALNQKLSPLKMPKSLIRFRETEEVCDSYNTMVSRISMASAQIEKLAFSDHVTGLPNRDHLHLQAASILEEAISPRRGGIILLIDLDDFKEINDLYGHLAGDQHLKACAETLSKVAQDAKVSTPEGKPFAPPIVARIGGDEFIVMIQGMIDDEEIEEFLAQVRNALAEPIAELNITPGASIGCAKFPNDGVELIELIKRADIAMYHAKRSGKNKTQVYAPHIGTKSVSEIRRDLTEAIEQEKLYLEYQPKVCTRRRKVISVEALARWEHPEFGLFMPKFWVPSLMGSNAMPRLGEWVMKTAMKDLDRMRSEGHDLWMSVNIGTDHFVSKGFISNVEAIRDELNFDPGLLEIEVTEDTLFSSEEKAVDAFNQLHDLGYRVSIDDFGRGYSNIARLANLPVDFLKIDQSIIAGASDDPRIGTIMAYTLKMAKELDCKTVAEGIETEQQAEFASRLGADCLQGYFFTPSLQVGELLNWLDAQPGSNGHPYLRETNDAVAQA